MNGGGRAARIRARPGKFRGVLISVLVDGFVIGAATAFWPWLTLPIFVGSGVLILLGSLLGYITVPLLTQRERGRVTARSKTTN